MRGIDPTLPSSVYLSLAFTPRASGKMESSPTVKQISMQFIPRNMHFCCKHERPPKAEGRCASYCSLKKVTVLLIKKKIRLWPFWRRQCPFTRIKIALIMSDGKLQHIHPFWMSNGNIQAHLSLQTTKNPSGKVFASKDPKVCGGTVV